VVLACEPVGWIGELHPRWTQKYELPKAPVVFEVDLEALLEVGLPATAAVPRFPEVQRDVALWFDEAVRLQDVYDVVGELAQADLRLRCLRRFRLFDLYRPSVSGSSKVEEIGANTMLIKEKSLAFRLHLQDTERTLAESHAEAAVAAIVEGLSTRLMARLRQ
jgi:phenylalanyl-tRNA synthetase beta chain